MTRYPLLDTISEPAQVRKLDRRQLPQLADELRAFLLESVARTGGHLSSNLGTVELTVALHHVFDTPHDRLVWDVGHQTYPHKALTGRRSGMGKLRMRGGVSGFPKRSESSYDTFRRRSFVDLDLGRAGHGAGRQDQGRDTQAWSPSSAMARCPPGRLLRPSTMPASRTPTCWSSSTTMTCRSRRRWGRSTSTWRASSRAAPSTLRARRGEKMLDFPNASLRIRQPRRGARQGHDFAGYAVRGNRLQLHRSDRRPRPRSP
jgi:hypothetical protein